MILIIAKSISFLDLITEIIFRRKIDQKHIYFTYWLHAYYTNGLQKKMQGVSPISYLFFSKIPSSTKLWYVLAFFIPTHSMISSAASTFFYKNKGRQQASPIIKIPSYYLPQCPRSARQKISIFDISQALQQDKLLTPLVINPSFRDSSSKWFALLLCPLLLSSMLHS